MGLREETVKKPNFAASVWSDGDWIYAEIPSAVGGVSHTLRFTNDQGGLAQILYLVRIRDHASKLGTKTSPTQWQVDRSKVKIRKVGRIKMVYTDAQAKKAKEILRRMGLI
jgi:hypothetical protein